MTEPAGRRRAPGMTPEERRSMIVRAALPLVAEFGGAVTTAQVARAAGIGEATVFRAFADKEALLQACIAEALNPETMLSELHSIPLDAPLADRLVEAAEALDAHLGRMGAVMTAIHASGMPNRRPPRDRVPAAEDRSSGRDASMAATRSAIIELFEPDEAGLRVSPAQAAGVFLQMQFGRPPLLESGDRRLMVDLFLHGALRQRDPAPVGKR
ncbi:TetR/AcrR family transcriptional regulator [Actinoplanes sp. NPDC049265]|uniref:TetR/AcrR family transcriptional regulator n=1 Tax=Actinoplanes sp. NPDC049265 TaxID=3363902 RepID=UPI0037168E88